MIVHLKLGEEAMLYRNCNFVTIKTIGDEQREVEQIEEDWLHIIELKSGDSIEQYLLSEDCAASVDGKIAYNWGSLPQFL